MPAVGSDVAEIEQSDLTPEEKLSKKEELMRDFAIKSERIHSVNQLLKAYTLLARDDEYIIDEGKVKIVAEQTVSIMGGRSDSEGRHKAIGAKEKTKVEG